MVGEQVLGRFTIEHRIGSGGFGTVYRAWDDRLARAVAVKVIERGGGARVMREAQAAARLAHPGIVTVYELAQDDHNAYLVTELIDGGTLRDLHYDGQLDDHSLALIGVEAADALAHAHAAGVVHRDIKPHNILIDEESGETKLVDFGIARLLDEPGLTADGEVLGTIAYMSPEQAEGEQPGPETDVYSLGLTLYEGWAGRQPVIKDTPAATARTIGDRLPPLRSFRRDLPTQLGALIDASVEPDARYRPSAVDLGEGLAEVAPSLGQRPLPVPGKKARRRRRASLPRVPVIAIAIIAMFAVIIATSHVHPDTWVVLAPVGCALLSFVRPRLALGLAAASLALWLATSASEPLQAAALAALGAAAIMRSGADLRRGGHPASHP